MSPSWATFLFETANFLLLAALLGWVFFRPVRDALERRRAELEAERREAEQGRSEAQRQLAELQKLRAEFEASLGELSRHGREEAEREGAQLLEAARERVRRERKALEGELDALRRSGVRMQAIDAVAAAREVVVRLLERIEGPDVERALLGAARHELAALAAGGALASVIVESARPLDDAALAELAEAAGVPPQRIARRVLPELVSGVRIVTSRGLVDASAIGLAEYAERAIVARIDADAAAHD